MAFTPFPATIPPETITDQTEKLTPVGADELLIADSEDSAAPKKIQIGNLPSTGGVKWQQKKSLTATAVGFTGTLTALTMNNLVIGNTYTFSAHLQADAKAGVIEAETRHNGVQLAKGHNEGGGTDAIIAIAPTTFVATTTTCEVVVTTNTSTFSGGTITYCFSDIIEGGTLTTDFT